MGLRRRSREAALKILYQKEMSGYDVEECLKLYWENLTDTKEIIDFCSYLVRGVVNNLSKIDERISTVSNNWAIDRMHKVDLCILRIAVFEMFFSLDIPLKVCINEAIELSKKFSTEEARGFVNGILGKIAEDLKQGGRV